MRDLSPDPDEANVFTRATGVRAMFSARGLSMRRFGRASDGVKMRVCQNRSEYHDLYKKEVTGILHLRSSH